MKNYNYILIFLFLIILINKNNLKENFTDKLFHGLTLYRIGDIVNSKTWRKWNNSDKYHLDNFPNTIASKYLKLTEDEGNFEILKNIVKNTKFRNKKLKLSYDYCLLHLRVGDIIDGDIWTVDQFLEEDRVNNYYKKKIVKSKHYFIHKINESKNYKIDNLVIIAASHMNLNSFAKSYEYIYKIKKLFSKRFKNIIIFYGNHPDDDMLLAHYAKYYISSGGSYSYLLSKITNGIEI